MTNLNAAARINASQRWAEQVMPLDSHSLYWKIDRFVKARPPGRVLETGVRIDVISRLRGRGWSVAGVDIQPCDLEYVVMHDAASYLSYRWEFDIVIATEVIRYIVDADAFFSNCHTALKPGDLFIVTTANLLFALNRLLMLFGVRPRFAYADCYVTIFVWADLREKVERYFATRQIWRSHVLVIMRRSRAAKVFAWMGDWLPTVSAHFIVVAQAVADD